jgi:hypothetical protein
MQELRWLENLPDKTLEGGVKLLNELEWNIVVREAEGVSYVSVGDSTTLVTSSSEAVDTFLYGPPSHIQCYQRRF